MKATKFSVKVRQLWCRRPMDELDELDHMFVGLRDWRDREVMIVTIDLYYYIMTTTMSTTITTHSSKNNSLKI